jgi:hypothetical protein
MKTTNADRHIKSLSLAKECVELGARIKTIMHITGVPHHELVRLFAIGELDVHHGRPPESSEWYHRANLIDKVEASVFAAAFLRLSALGFGPADALIGAYKLYRERIVHVPRVTFDRAFGLVCHLCGIWVRRQSQLELSACPACHSEYLAAPGDRSACVHGCPFCKLVKRYRDDARVRASFPPQPSPRLARSQLGLLAHILAIDIA